MNPHWKNSPGLRSADPKIEKSFIIYVYICKQANKLFSCVSVVYMRVGRVVWINNC